MVIYTFLLYFCVEFLFNFHLQLLYMLLSLYLKTQCQVQPSRVLGNDRPKGPDYFKEYRNPMCLTRQMVLMQKNRQSFS